MFEGFTPPARQAIAAAEEGARRLGQPEAGTAHVLLGLVEDGTTTPTAAALRSLGVTADAVRAAIRRSHGLPEEPPRHRRGLLGRGRAPHAPLNQDAKRVLTFALRESTLDERALIAASDLLRGVLRAPGGEDLLTGLGVDADVLRGRLVGLPTAGD